jgi:hypothetical protein
MSDNLSNITFESILDIFKVVWRDFILHGTDMASKPPEFHLKNLQAVTEKIGSKIIKRPPPQEIYIRQWNDFLARRVGEVSRGTVRYLCWEPNVATSKRFLDYLDSSGFELGARSIQGLVRSCHARWSYDFASGAEISKVKSIVLNYQGSNRAISKWKGSINTLLGEEGHYLFAKDILLGNMKKIEELTNEWALDEQSAYIRSAIIHAANLCLDFIVRYKEYGNYLFSTIFPWKGWESNSFKEAIGKTILHPSLQVGSAFFELFRNFILGDKERLGDPRLRAYRQNWIGIQLSREDIVFFFEHVLPKGSDKHGRKNFWLLYVNQCVSRPMLCRDDRVRLQTLLNQDRIKVGHFGHKQGMNSAFILDFGAIIAVEFSRVGACYYYKAEDFKRIIPDYWTNRSLREDELRNQSLCIDRIRHIITDRIDWRKNATSLLARYGIRPTRM